MKRIAIIPARGGSKRIPKKNIKDFHGKPIISYSILTCIESGFFERVIVSTDDEEIAKVSLSYGAEVPFFRSEKNSNDIATTADVIIEVLKTLELESEFYDYCLCLYPTAPFVTAENLKLSFEKLRNQSYDIVYPIVQYSYPIQRAVVIDHEGKTRLIKNENLKIRSQDLEPTYHDAGQYYWIDVPIFHQKKEILTNNTGSILIDELHSQDIDNLSDWEIAELKFEYLQKRKFKN